jgi:hypothetical protein
MEHDVLLMFVVGAGLLALGGLARALPGGGLVLAPRLADGGPLTTACRVQGRRGVDDTTPSLSMARRGLCWAPPGAGPVAVDAARGQEC